MYSVKEIFLTIQGEGYNSGRKATFCRFSGCNLWNGIETSKKTAILAIFTGEKYGRLREPKALGKPKIKAT